MSGGGSTTPLQGKDTSGDATAHTITPQITAEGQIQTLNNHGFQMSRVSVLYDAWTAGYDGVHPLGDLGCAFGLHTIPAVKAGYPVIAMDMDTKHLEYTREAVGRACEDRADSADTPFGTVTTSVCVLPGGFLGCNDIVKPGTFSSLLVAEVIHFLTDEQLEPAFAELFASLVPGGRLCLSCISAFGGRGFMYDTVQEQARSGAKYPGFMDRERWQALCVRLAEDSGITMAPSGQQIEHIHVFLPESVRALAEGAGFVVDALVLQDNPGYPSYFNGVPGTDVHNKGNVQLIAHKPK